MRVTFDLRHLLQLAPNARETYREAFAHADVLADSGLLDHSRRLAHFLAQVCHETAGLTLVVESLNYRAERLVEVWPSRFHSIEQARPFAGNEQALAAKVYDGRTDLGNVLPGDGFRFRGRGLLQITGRSAYARVGVAIGIDLVGQPYLAASPDYALRVALEIWRSKGCDAYADAGDLVRVTRAINGGVVGLVDRLAWLEKAQALLGLA